MSDRSKFIIQLEDFKSLLDRWWNGDRDVNTRSNINKKIRNVRQIVLRAGTLKTYTISPPPMIGGLIMNNVDPFSIIFNPPYDMSMIPNIKDMIDEAIGVIESSSDFTIDLSPKDKSNQKVAGISNRIFLVHGRDNVLKESTARFIEKLGLEAIILHEKSSKGLTVIEKFEEYSDVAFAIIIMTPDDIGGLATNKDDLQKRARQNVIFELGYFIGKLSRKNVVALVQGKIEIPSDYTGVMYIGIDNKDAWKIQLAKEMKSAGLKIDLNRIFQ